MRARFVFVNLPKDGRRVLEGFHFPAKQPDRPAPYRLGKGEFSARQNTNYRPRILLGGEPSRACVIEVAGDQFVANFGWSRQLLSSVAPLRDAIEEGRSGKMMAFCDRSGIPNSTPGPALEERRP